jgi:hypothetical protein
MASGLEGERKMDKEAMKIRNAALHRLQIIARAREELCQLEIQYEELTDQRLLSKNGRSLVPLKSSPIDTVSDPVIGWRSDYKEETDGRV